MRQIRKGSTNISVDLYIIDSTTGQPELGVLFNTTGIDLEYRRDLSAIVNVTEVTLAALTTAHTDGGFLDGGYGSYRFDVPDAAFATGARKVTIQGTVTGMIVLPAVIQLVDFDPEDSVRMGQTALPNAAADAAGGLPVSDTGALDLDALNAAAVRLTAVRAQVLDDWVNAGRLDAILDSRMAEASIATTSGAVDLVVDVFNDVGITQAGADKVWGSTLRQLTATGLDLILFSSTGVIAIARAIWEYLSTGSFPNNSFGKIIRDLKSTITITSGTAQAGTANTITLAAGSSSTDDIYQGDSILITGGTGVEEHGLCISYNGTTKVATMSKPWVITPDNTSEYQVSPMDVNVESWGNVKTTNSATTQKPEVDGVLAAVQPDYAPAKAGDAMTVSIGGFPVGGFAAGAITDAALAVDAETSIAAAVLAGIVETEGSYTLQQVLSVVLSVCAGETSSNGATLLTPNGVATRVSAILNASNERTGITITPSA